MNAARAELFKTLDECRISFAWDVELLAFLLSKNHASAILACIEECRARGWGDRPDCKYPGECGVTMLRCDNAKHCKVYPGRHKPDEPAQPSAIPDGFVLVPKVPTEAMHDAANREWDGRMSARSAGVYEAMIAAAPSSATQVTDCASVGGGIAEADSRKVESATSVKTGPVLSTCGAEPLACPASAEPRAPEPVEPGGTGLPDEPPRHYFPHYSPNAKYIGESHYDKLYAAAERLVRENAELRKQLDDVVHNMETQRAEAAEAALAELKAKTAAGGESK